MRWCAQRNWRAYHTGSAFFHIFKPLHTSTQVRSIDLDDWKNDWSICPSLFFFSLFSSLFSLLSHSALWARSAGFFLSLCPNRPRRVKVMENMGGNIKANELYEAKNKSERGECGRDWSSFQRLNQLLRNPVKTEVTNEAYIREKVQQQQQLPHIFFPIFKMRGLCSLCPPSHEGKQFYRVLDATHRHSQTQTRTHITHPTQQPTHQRTNNHTIYTMHAQAFLVRRQEVAWQIQGSLPKKN